MVVIKNIAFGFHHEKQKTKTKTRTTYFQKQPHFLIEQPRTCRNFMLCCIKSKHFLTRNRFPLNSRSHSEINSLASNKWTLYQYIVNIWPLTQ